MASRIATCGSHQHGQLGRATSPSTGLTFVEDLPEISFVACGSNHSLAISNLGIVYGWGLNTHAQLGNPLCDSVTAPKKLDMGCLVSVFILKCAAGARNSVLLTHNGDVIEIGDGSGEPRRIAIGDRVVDVACSSFCRFGSTASGVLYVWSDVRQFSLPKPAVLPPKTRVARIGASEHCSMIITSSGDLLISMCSKTDNSSENLSWQFLRNTGALARDVYCGYSHSAVVYTDGSVRIVGKEHIRCPDVAGAACGRETTFLWNSSGKLFVCGRNDEGQLGLSPCSMVQEPREVELPPGLVVSQISCGVDHTIVLMQDKQHPPRRASSGYSVPMEDMILPIDDIDDNTRWDEEISNISFSKSAGWKKFLAAGTKIGDPIALIPEHHDPFSHTRRVLLFFGAAIVLALIGSSVGRKKNGTSV